MRPLFDALIVYLGMGCLAMGMCSRRWWAEMDVLLARMAKAQGRTSLGPVARTIILAITVTLDVILWPSTLRRWWIESRAAELATRAEREFQEATRRMAGCAHVNRTLVDVGTPMVKCRDCWAIQSNGTWFANSYPPPFLSSEKEP